MKTFRLLLTIIALGFFSLSCSNEELNLQTEDSAIESDFARGGLPVMSPPQITVGGVEFNFISRFDKGKLRLEIFIDATPNNISIKFGSSNCINGSVPSFGRPLATGLKRKDMSPQTFSGCVMVENDGNYEFSFTIVNSKEITTAANETGTVCCP